MDFRSVTLGLIPAILLLVFVIALPVVGYFAGYKRALYWSVGNMLFIFLGWAIWAGAGESICQGFVGMFGFSEDAIADIMPIMVATVAPIWYIIFILIGNFVLLILWYSLFKWLLRLTKKQKTKHFKDKDSLKAEVSFFKRNQILSRSLGGGIMFLSFLPIASTFTESFYAFTVSAQQREEDGFVNGMYKFAHGVSNINYIKYFTEPTTQVDAALTVMEDGAQEAIETAFSSSTKTLNDISLGVENYFDFISGKINDLSDPSYLNILSVIQSFVSYESLIKSVQDAIGSGQNITDWQTTVEPNIGNLNIIFKSYPMTETIMNTFETGIEEDEKEEINRTIFEEIGMILNLDFNVQDFIDEDIWLELESDQKQSLQDELDSKFNVNKTQQAVVYDVFHDLATGNNLFSPLNIPQKNFNLINNRVSSFAFSYESMTAEEIEQFEIYIGYLLGNFFQIK